LKKGVTSNALETGNKFAAGVNDAQSKFSTGVNGSAPSVENIFEK
jgi:hypothetical protein